MWDYDIISSTNNECFVNGKYPDQRVVTYAVKSPKKREFTEDDLFVTDTFSFGTQIGQITNTCSTICALMGNFDKDSKEYKILGDRLKAGCAAQSRQIDKTKIGENVKTMGTICKTFQRINHEEDSDELIELKNFYNTILADKKPYFFRYKYKALNKEYNDYIKKTKENAVLRFGVELEELLEKEKNDYDQMSFEEKTFVMYYHKFLPVVDSDCVMNNVCKYIEGIDFQIKQKIKNKNDFNYSVLQSDGFQIKSKEDKEEYENIKEEIRRTFKEWEAKSARNKKNSVQKSMGGLGEQKKFERQMECELLKNRLEYLCYNEEKLCNYLIELFYVDKPAYSKSTLWQLVGKQIYENIRNRVEYCYAPVKDECGDIEFLYERYGVKKVDLREIEGESKVENDGENEDGLRENVDMSMNGQIEEQIEEQEDGPYD